MKVWSKWKPPPKLTISQWADEYRRLSAEASAEPGKWRTDRAPFQREMMDACLYYEDVVIMSSAQVGKSEAIYNIIGYHMHYDPCPVLFVFPTVEMAEDQSKSRIAPMLRDTPALADLFSSKAKTSQNTLLNKSFPGGYLALAGSNSPASLASRPVRMVLCDEVDRYPSSAGTEGDPVNLAFKRTTTFWNRRRIIVSTPTIKDSSRIEIAYQNSDQRKYFVPCPHCHEMQTLKFVNVRWEKDDLGVDLPETAVYMCDHCGAVITDSERLQIQKFGEWRKMNPKNTKVAGFHINQLYSPWSKLETIVNDFVLAKDKPDLLKTWINTTLGESFDDSGGETIEAYQLKARAESYKSFTIPEGAYFITAGVDVQDNRVAVLIEAWGRDMECWIVYYTEIFGNLDDQKIWNELDELLSRKFQHEKGFELKIIQSAIDSGGHYTQAVYNFVRHHQYKHYKIIAIKGSSTAHKPVITKASLVDFNYRGEKIPNGVQKYDIGTDTAKNYIYNNLKKVSFGPGYVHFNIDLTYDFYEMLTAEKRIVEFKNGFPKHKWIKANSRRNEALDCKVYSLAAAHLAGLERISWDKIDSDFKNKYQDYYKDDSKILDEQSEEIPEKKEEPNIQKEDIKPPVQTVQKRRNLPQRGSGFVNGFKW